jgi:hypothetical protein
VLNANGLHNAAAASAKLVGHMPCEGFLVRTETLGFFRHFGCHGWLHNPGGPHYHRLKLAQRGLADRFHGFARPLGPGVYQVLLDDGREMQSQTVVFDQGQCVPLLVLFPAPEVCAALPSANIAPHACSKEYTEVDNQQFKVTLLRVLSLLMFPNTIATAT